MSRSRHYIEVWTNDSAGTYLVERIGTGDGQALVHCKHPTRSTAWRQILSGQTRPAFATPSSSFEYRMINESREMVAVYSRITKGELV